MKKRNSKTKKIAHQPDRHARSKAGHAPAWKIVNLYDESERVFQIAFDFPTIALCQGRLVVGRNCIDRPTQILSELHLKGAALPAEKAEALEFVSKLLAGLDKTVFTNPARTGWRDNGRTFVLPQRILGENTERLIVNAELADENRIGPKSGKLATWKTQVGKPAGQSTFMSFAIMAGLAGPLAESAQLSELAIFNFAGKSGAGKTTALKVAASVSGLPHKPLTWFSSERGLDELAAAHNDLLLILDDTDKIRDPKKTVFDFVDSATHSLTGGQSKNYGKLAKSSGLLSDLAWTCLILSTSPYSIERATGLSGKKRNDGDRVRFMDIPVPHPDEGGVFDHVKAEPEKRKKICEELAEAIETGMGAHYGVLLPAWIKFLMRKDRSARVRKLINKFVAKVAAGGNSYDRRYAKKFGLVYAAGKIAVEEKLLPWPDSLPLKVASKCYRLARAEIIDPDAQINDLIRKLASLSKDPMRFPRISHSGDNKTKVSVDRFGVRFKDNGFDVIAMDRDRLCEFTGPGLSARSIGEALDTRGLLAPGTEGNRTSQIRHRFPLGSERPYVYKIIIKKLIEVAGQTESRRTD